MGVVQTHEVDPYDIALRRPANRIVRPGLEGRFEFFYNLDDNRRLEIAPGFHTSTTHVNGISIPSSLFSLDWFFNPLPRVEFTGAFFAARTLAISAPAPSTKDMWSTGAPPRRSTRSGGWASSPFTPPSASTSIFSPEARLLEFLLGTGDVSRSLMFGTNLFFRLAPNVLLGPEISQTAKLVYWARDPDQQPL